MLYVMNERVRDGLFICPVKNPINTHFLFYKRKVIVFPVYFPLLYIRGGFHEVTCMGLEIIKTTISGTRTSGKALL